MAGWKYYRSYHTQVIHVYTIDNFIAILHYYFLTMKILISIILLLKYNILIKNQIIAMSWIPIFKLLYLVIRLLIHVDFIEYRILDLHPNTYTFSKRLSEKLIADEYPNLPCSIARPSIGKNITISLANNYFSKAISRKCEMLYKYILQSWISTPSPIFQLIVYLTRWLLLEIYTFCYETEMFNFSKVLCCNKYYVTMQYIFL